MGMYNSKDYRDHKIGDVIKPVVSTGPGLTKQEFAKETNINNICDRYMKTGQLSGLRVDGLQPIFADVSKIGDYADVLRRVDAAKEAFASLPAEVRFRFHNNPVELVSFVQDDSNYDEAVTLGLIDEKPKKVDEKPKKAVGTKNVQVPPVPAPVPDVK